MTETQNTPAASPFATLWLSPRATIEGIVTARTTYMVLPLAMLGTIAGFFLQLLAANLAAHVADWRFWLGVIVGGAVVGVIWLYWSSLLLKWIGYMLGGDATARQLRAALAWSTLPSIVGALIVASVILVL